MAAQANSNDAMPLYNASHSDSSDIGAECDRAESAGNCFERARVDTGTSYLFISFISIIDIQRTKRASHFRMNQSYILSDLLASDY